jgi:hypothetical protein
VCRPGARGRELAVTHGYTADVVSGDPDGLVAATDQDDRTVTDAPAVAGAGGAASGAEDTSHAGRDPVYRALRIAGVAVLALWAMALGAFSTVIYHRAFLGEDFATYNQAWTLIGQGHLNPYDTVFGFPFVKADFELILWPLALLHLVTPNPVVLLWVQDLAVAGSGLVAYLWALEYVERRRIDRRVAVAVAVVVLIATMVNPGTIATLSFDLHMEPLSTFFLLLAAREFWRGRPRRGWIWVIPVLACGSFAALMVIGLGVSALLARPDTRRSGVLLVVTGLAWTALISALHANLGSGLSLYAYLAGRTTLTGAGGVALILGGIAAHPGRVVHQLDSRLGAMWVLIKPVGIVGLASAWGFGVPAVVLVTDGLNSRADFLNNAFQNFAVFPFLLVGTVMVLVWLAQRFRTGWAPAVVVGVVVALIAFDYGYRWTPAYVRASVGRVQPAPAARLRTALAATPPDAQVIASVGIMGRFCSRQSCWFNYPNGARPVQRHDVVFVFSAPDDATTTPAGTAMAVAYVRDQLHARTLVDGDGVTAFLWHPPPGTTEVTVPGVTPPA